MTLYPIQGTGHLESTVQLLITGMMQQPKQFTQLILCLKTAGLINLSMIL